MKSQKIPVLLISNFFEPGPAEKLAERTGAKLAILPASVEGEEGLEDPVAFFEHLISGLDAAFRQAEAR
jgi:hypothetical protein